ncbi:hypothetical protein (Partial), partial [Seminavis robusta]
QEIVLISESPAVGRYPRVENPFQATDNVGVSSSIGQSFNGRSVVPVGSNMRPTNPPDQISHTPVKVQQGGSGHLDTVEVQLGLRFPASWVSTDSAETGSPKLRKELFENKGRVVGGAKC